MSKRKTKIKLIFYAVMVLLAILIVIILVSTAMPQIKVILKSGNQEIAQKYLRSFGIEGIFITFLLQIFQVISIIIPMPTVPVIAGVTYGVFVGLLISLAGIAVGNIIVFTVSRKLDKKLLTDLFDSNQPFIFNALDNLRRPGLVLFFLYIIPVLPNGIIPYIFSRTNMSLKKFIIITTIASVPSILFCTFLGDYLLHGNLILISIILAVAVVLFLLFWFNRRKLMSVISKFGRN